MQVVCVDDLVPADDDLRRIEALVDWGQARRTAEPFYRPGGAGRPGIDPAVLVKLALVLAWRGLPSRRATLWVARTDVSIRRFLGFGLTERLPVTKAGAAAVELETAALDDTQACHLAGVVASDA
jgi:transposase